MMHYRGLVRLGGLVHRDCYVSRAKRPWITDLSALCPYDGIEPGDIAEFETDPDWRHWSLADTPEQQDQQLQWHAFESSTGRLLVCDRMILTRISWQDLDEAGFVDGAPVTLDGLRYTCRLLTGGQSALDDPHQGAQEVNEWDQLMGGTVDGAPRPSSRDLTPPLCPDHLHGGHNHFWNWFGAVSWTAEPFAGRANGRVCRGYHGPLFFYVNTVDHRHEDIGWRPVLERRDSD